MKRAKRITISLLPIRPDQRLHIGQGAGARTNSRMAGRVRAEIRYETERLAPNCFRSSVVEHRPCKAEVAGSNPCREHQ